MGGVCVKAGGVPFVCVEIDRQPKAKKKNLTFFALKFLSYFPPILRYIISQTHGEKIKIKVNPLENSCDIITIEGKGICGGDMIIKFNINFDIFYNNANDSIEKLKQAL